MAGETGVNAPRTVMLTIGEIADRDGVSKPAVSRKVKDLVARHRLSVERDRQGRVARINVAEYDHLRGLFADPSKAQAPRPATQPVIPIETDETYNEALRQRTWHEAERKRLEVAELKGELVRVDRVTDAVIACCEEVNRVIDRMPNATDELANTVAREGSQGLRVALKALAIKMRGEIADAMERVAAAEPKSEPAPQ